MKKKILTGLTALVLSCGTQEAVKPDYRTDLRAFKHEAGHWLTGCYSNKCEEVRRCE